MSDDKWLYESVDEPLAQVRKMQRNAKIEPNLPNEVLEIGTNYETYEMNLALVLPLDVGVLSPNNCILTALVPTTTKWSMTMKNLGFVSSVLTWCRNP